jgi:hypothetical protein
MPAPFDQVFAELQAKMSAAIAVIAQYPEIAAEVRDAIDAAQTEAEIAEGQAQDAARANALASVMTEVRTVLAEAVGVTPQPETPEA